MDMTDDLLTKIISLLKEAEDLEAKGNPEALHQAIAAYDQAIACARPGRYTEAEEEAETGLALLRDSEIAGVFHLRGRREWLFDLTLTCALAARQHPILPEICLEHLDPANPGAAPASAAMHRAALDALRRGLTDILHSSRHLTLLQSYQQTLARLTEIAALYFSGTATAAELRAQDQALRGDTQAAQAELDAYTQACPADPEGWRLLGGFLSRHGDREAAGGAWVRMARCLVFEAPAGSGRDDRARRIAQVGSALLAQDLAALPASNRERLLAESDRLLIWLRAGFRDAVLSPPAGGRFDADWLSGWQSALDGALEGIQGDITGLRDRLLAAQDREQRKAAGQAAIDFGAQLLRQSTEGLETAWRAFVDHLLLAWKEIVEQHLPAWLAAKDVSEHERVLAEAADGLALAVERATRQLAWSELAESAQALEALFGAANWRGILSEAERRFLAAGHRCLQMAGARAEFTRYAGLELGLALESALRERLFIPLRETLVKSGFAQLEGVERPVQEYMGQRRGVLTLGSMAGFYGTLLRRWHNPPASLHAATKALLQDWLGEGAGRLRGNDSQCQRRADALDQASQQRNRCAHRQESPQPGEVTALWDALVTDREDGFFYCLGASGWRAA